MTDTDAQADAYDAAAKKLEAALTVAFPHCKWWVPTSYDMIRWEIEGWGDMIQHGRLEVNVKRDGYGARVPCTVELADYPDAVLTIGQVAIYTMDRARGGDIDPGQYGIRTLPEG